LIGETGVPFDMKKTGLLGFGLGKEDKTDYKEPSKVILPNHTTCQAD